MTTYTRSETATNGIEAEANDLMANGFVSIPLGRVSSAQERSTDRRTRDAQTNRAALGRTPVADAGIRSSDGPLVFFVGVSDKHIPAALSFAKAALRGLHVGASPDAVREAEQARGLEVSELMDGVVYASAPARGGFPLVRAKWLLQFRFDDGERLADVQLRRGVTGP